MKFFLHLTNHCYKFPFVGCDFKPPLGGWHPHPSRFIIHSPALSGTFPCSEFIQFIRTRYVAYTRASCFCLFYQRPPVSPSVARNAQRTNGKFRVQKGIKSSITGRIDKCERDVHFQFRSLSAGIVG